MTMSNVLNIPANAKDVKIMNYINGEWMPPTSGSYMMSYNPATGEEMTPIPDSMDKDIDNAVCAAKNAFPMWSMMPAVERAAIMNRVADMIEENCQQLAMLESQDQGKPVMSAAMKDMPSCANFFRQFAKYVVDGIMETKSTSNAMMTNMSTTKREPYMMMATTQHVPSGVAGLITPWNFPMQMVCEKLAPCIAVGNTCVVKPSEMTSVTAFMMTQIMEAAGMPAGVVNFVFGTGPKAGEPLVKHKDVRLISFTGGSLTGSRIGAMAGGMYKRVSLELGGKNPSIVFNDCDMNHAVATNVRAAFQNQGEICLCCSRQYVQRDVYDMYLQMFRKMTMEEVMVGDPSNPKTFYGPMVSKQHMEKVMSYIRLAREEGAKVEFLVNPSDKMVMNVSKDGMMTIKGIENGYYMAPTLITGMKQNSRLMQEEIFGPVVCVMPFKAEEEAVQMANDTQYGLGACVWTMDKMKMMRVMKQINAGTVWGNDWLNTDECMPFGGMGCSGTSREHGPWSLEFYTETKALYYPSMN
ncbi:hypothetical protein IWW52_001906 [Coemansia sp. RSA 2704]|nr:hypothetical protein IWW52_001906 [Coemansia sp. RSA 2704]